jgi:hypothetical protein
MEILAGEALSNDLDRFARRKNGAGEVRFAFTSLA